MTETIDEKLMEIMKKLNFDLFCAELWDCNIEEYKQAITAIKSLIADGYVIKESYDSLVAMVKHDYITKEEADKEGYRKAIKALRDYWGMNISGVDEELLATAFNIKVGEQ
jgi:hypothetical protein